jgi:hypothetical protein
MSRLTVKNVMEKVYTNAEVRKYLPDYEEEPEKYMNRDFLFAIVNRIDPTFFLRVSAEIGTPKPKKVDDHKVTDMQIKPELLEVLQLAKARQVGKQSLSNARALLSILGTNKKRKRPTKSEEEGIFKAAIDLKKFKR